MEVKRPVKGHAMDTPTQSLSTEYQRPGWGGTSGNFEL